MTLSKEQVRKKYEEMAPHFDRLEGVAEWLGIRSLRREVFGRAAGRVLEVAIGTGLSIPLYDEGVEHLVGVDLSSAMLERARPRAAGAPFPVELHEADAEGLPFEEARFDTVTSSLSTCTFPDPVGALQEMRRVVKPAGRIVLLEHGRSSNFWLARFQDWRAESHERVLGCRWNQEPRELVRAADLRVSQERRVFFGVFHILEIDPGTG